MFTRLLEFLKRSFSRVEQSGSSDETAATDKLPNQLLSALGSRQNVLSLDACTTRLRVRIGDAGKVDKERLRQLGALGVWEMDNDEIHILFGARVNTIKLQLREIIEETAVRESTDASSIGHPSNPDSHTERETIVSPADGELLDLSFVPDTFFSRRMIGDGFAVRPSSGRILSPVNGTVLTVFPGKHAVGILSEAGREILVHIGVNTVKLKGQGFNVCVAEGESVVAGQQILEVDLDYVEKHAASIITPVVFINLPGEAAVELLKSGVVRAGEQPIVRIMARGSQIFK